MEEVTMKFEIIGSGGCVALPKPLCKCNVCVEARDKGRPYQRHGCSIFLHDLNLLIDTPEDIVHALNKSEVEHIERVMFSHLDPDHTLGFRLFEHLRLNWFEISEGRECVNPIEVMALPHVMSDLNAIKSVYGGFLDYYEGTRNLITRREVSSEFVLGDIQVTLVRIERSTIFVFKKNGKKLIYSFCDIIPFPDHDVFYDADYLIIGDTFIGDVLKGGYVLAQDNMLRQSLFSMEEIEGLKAKYNVENVVVTHIEEDWGKSYDDYLELEDRYENIRFAYDGMTIEI